MKHWITIQNNVVRRTNITERLSIVVEKIVNYNEKLKEIVNGKALVEKTIWLEGNEVLVE